MKRPVIGVSRCLLGERVRYDGGARYEPYIIESLESIADLMGLCPEVECGMPIPREPAEIGGTPLSPAFICVHTGRNLTSLLMPWVRQRLELFAREPVHGMVLKSNSPSCAAVTPKPVFLPNGNTAGRSFGLFARAFRQRFPWVPVADEVSLADPLVLEEFVERVRACARKRWSALNDWM